MMTNKKAYQIIAKHIFVAQTRYYRNSECVIILADDIAEAREKAKQRFGSEVDVWLPDKIAGADILRI